MKVDRRSQVREDSVNWSRRRFKESTVCNEKLCSRIKISEVSLSDLGKQPGV